MMVHRAQAGAKRLTEKADEVSKSRYCRSCNLWRRPTGGVNVPIKVTRNFYWRCSVCESRRSKP